MKYEATKIPNYFSIAIKLYSDHDEIMEILQTVYNSKKHEFKLQGFRPGKVPLNIILKKFTLDYFIEDICETKISRDFQSIIDEININGGKNISGIAENEFNFINHRKWDRLTYDIVEFTIDSLAISLQIDYVPKITFSDEIIKEIDKEYLHNLDNIQYEIEEHLLRLLDNQTKIVNECDIDDLVDESSVVHVVACFEDSNGKYIPIRVNDVLPAIASPFDINIQSSLFPEDLRKGLLGMKVAQFKSIQVNVTNELEKYIFLNNFKYNPDPDSADNYSNCIAHVYVSKIIRVKNEVLDDEFVKDISYFDSLDEFRKFLMDASALKRNTFINYTKYYERLTKATFMYSTTLMSINGYQDLITKYYDKALGLIDNINKYFTTSEKAFIDDKKAKEFFDHELIIMANESLLGSNILTTYNTPLTYHQIAIEALLICIDNLIDKDSIYHLDRFIERMTPLLNDLIDEFANELYSDNQKHSLNVLFNDSTSIEEEIKKYSCDGSIFANAILTANEILNSQLNIDLILQVIKGSEDMVCFLAMIRSYFLLKKKDEPEIKQ
ncbi:MAG: hypothetical protein LBF68_01825 [Christensenellaceae bacterium]|jgi:FKBP-type peptidyl-prolyl cis-trans isomerase (trigger factor)|nr:hypothetical protein [Christensenellaceae bacterium]